MADSDPPFGNFRFRVAFFENPLGTQAAGAKQSVADGAFSECTGLEATMEPKVVKEGGRNYGANQRSGPVSFATIVLRRGITRNLDLWSWFNRVAATGGTSFRMDVRIEHLGLDESLLRAWHLNRALAVKFKTADMNARGGEVALEELHLVHEGLSLEKS